MDKEMNTKIIVNNSANSNCNITKKVIKNIFNDVDDENKDFKFCEKISTFSVKVEEFCKKNKLNLKFSKNNFKLLLQSLIIPPGIVEGGKNTTKYTEKHLYYYVLVEMLKTYLGSTKALMVVKKMSIYIDLMGIEKVTKLLLSFDYEYKNYIKKISSNVLKKLNGIMSVESQIENKKEIDPITLKISADFYSNILNAFRLFSEGKNYLEEMEEFLSEDCCKEIIKLDEKETKKALQFLETEIIKGWKSDS